MSPLAFRKKRGILSRNPGKPKKRKHPYGKTTSRPPPPPRPPVFDLHLVLRWIFSLEQPLAPGPALHLHLPAAPGGVRRVRDRPAQRPPRCPLRGGQPGPAEGGGEGAPGLYFPHRGPAGPVPGHAPQLRRVPGRGPGGHRPHLLRHRQPRVGPAGRAGAQAEAGGGGGAGPHQRIHGPGPGRGQRRPGGRRRPQRLRRPEDPGGGGGGGPRRLCRPLLDTPGPPEQLL